ncbi:MAG: UDP binding domain-containing protein, partial [Ekhidna sp.]
SKTPKLAKIIRTAREVNDAKPEWVIEKIEAAIGSFLIANPDKTAKDVSICCYGLAFKADIDDLRESPALNIAKQLSERHSGRVLAVEPNIAKLPKDLDKIKLVQLDAGILEADVHVMLVAHKEFKAVESWSGLMVDSVGI